MDDAWSGGVYDAGDLVADDDRRFGSVGIEPDAGEDVGEVDARGADPDADFARSRYRVGRFTSLEYVCATVAGNDHLTHLAGA
jgi:hypothetical protein